MACVDSSPMLDYTEYDRSLKGWKLRIRDDAPQWAKEEFKREKERWEYCRSAEGMKALNDSME